MKHLPSSRRRRSRPPSAPSSLSAARCLIKVVAEWSWGMIRRANRVEGTGMQVTRQRRGSRDLWALRRDRPPTPHRRTRRRSCRSRRPRGWPTPRQTGSATTRSAPSTPTGSRSPTTRSSSRSATVCSPSSASSWARPSARTGASSRPPAPTGRWSCRSSTCRATSSSGRSAPPPASTRAHQRHRRPGRPDVLAGRQVPLAPGATGVTRFPVNPDGTLGTPTTVSIPTVSGHAALMGQIAYSPDGSTLYAAVNGQNTVVGDRPQHRRGQADVERRHRPA